jgi:hypothetical protein
VPCTASKIAKNEITVAGNLSMGTRKRITIAKPPFLTTFVDQASQSSQGMAIIVEGNSKNE